ncbi:transmembrane 7 superfamily member 3-like [Mya arenaria]|uniref:transmembrane 7 superfamily member 3-like n=1 Tax=Mya arenaria TaxID=6604 RepID=UPI0022E38BF6|nr:transmembrane 7 superfamily member 3-like [Mya arenaria]
MLFKSVISIVSFKFQRFHINMKHFFKIKTLLILVTVTNCLQGQDTVDISNESPTILNIHRNNSTVIQAVNVTEGTKYILCQVHSQIWNVSLSVIPEISYGSSLTGRDVGMLAVLPSDQPLWYMYLTTNSSEEIRILLQLTFLTQYDPLPGGCNEEFSLRNDPNIHLAVATTKTTVSFSWAGLVNKPDCDKGPVGLDYDLYVTYMEADIFTEEQYFEVLRHVLTAASVRDYSRKVYSVSNSEAQKSQIHVSSYPKRGVIYSIVARYLNSAGQKTTFASYVPTVSYGCNLQDDHSCGEKDVAAIIFTTVGGFVGLFLCYYGHRFFKTEIFVFGFLMFGVLFYQIFALKTNVETPGLVVLAAIFGLLGGSILLGVWWNWGFPIINVLCIGLLTGYIFSSILFYTPFGNLTYWNGAFNYGGTFASGCLLVPVLLLCFTRLLNIVSCGLIGGYLFVLMFDQYMSSGMANIVLNSIRHGTDTDYRNVLVTGPFTEAEKGLTAAWVLVCVTGVAFQLYTQRKRAPFPPCPRKQRASRGDLRALLRGRGEHPSRRGNSENERLIRGENRVQYGTNNGSSSAADSEQEVNTQGAI